MRLTHWERLTLAAIQRGDTGPHRVSVLRSLVRRGLLDDRQALTPAGLRLAVEEVTRRRDAGTADMRAKIRAYRRRY